MVFLHVSLETLGGRLRGVCQCKRGAEGRETLDVGAGWSFGSGESYGKTMETYGKNRANSKNMVIYEAFKQVTNQWS